MRARSQCFSLQKSEIARKLLSFIHFTHGFRSLHGSELKYFWKLCQARRQQLTFFNQAWEIGPQAWAGLRFIGVRVGRYTFSRSTVCGLRFRGLCLGCLENTDLETADLENVVCFTNWEASSFYKINWRKKISKSSKLTSGPVQVYW